eukprot:TRINITY_DN2180_c0_g1_i2.p1 TRINITY_DN2180_c0_g1~~TRINITY_DN2180_c0_g1_i2.p1  ORF type:complete len:620 (+),score=146.76 TRINITY_DN2180_c0_g1_i2:1142-3001(+)
MIEIPLCILVNGNPIESRYTLLPSDEKQCCADVHISLQLTANVVSSFENCDPDLQLRPMVNYGNGLLAVTVMDAAGIDKKHTHLFFTLNVDKQDARTEGVDASNGRAVFNCNFFFEATEKSVLELVLWGQRMVKVKHLGHATFKMKALPAGGEQVEGWYFLTPRRRNKNVGSVHVTYSYIPFSSMAREQIMFHQLYSQGDPLAWGNIKSRQTLYWTQELVKCPLFDPECKKRCFHLEDSPECISTQPPVSAQPLDPYHHQPSTPPQPLCAKAGFDVSLAYPYYMQYLAGTEHTIYFSETDFGPILVAVSGGTQYRRVMIIHRKGTLRFVVPDTLTYMKNIRASFPRLVGQQMFRTKTSAVQEDVTQFERAFIMREFKFGLLYAKAGQRHESEMLLNASDDVSDAYKRFLMMLGKQVKLKGWSNYRGGLDTKDDHHGTHSLYTVLSDMEIMFHVCTLLPKENNSQQIIRKKHIGNDLVVLIFKERAGPDDTVDVTSFKTQLTHVFVCVSPVIPEDGYEDKTPVPGTGEEDLEAPKSPSQYHDVYRISVCHRDVLSPFPPFAQSSPAVLVRGASLREFLLTKMIHAEFEIHRLPYFRKKLDGTRREMLESILKTCKSNLSQ